MELVLPSEKYKESFFQALEEKREEQKTSKERYLEINEILSDFAGYLKRLDNESKGVNLKEGRVPSTDYWLVDEGKYIGRVSIRHRLTENLEKIGGHIGYDIRPSERKKGYGSQMLHLALPKAKELGITKALLTCDSDNIGSKKIIEKNGGVFESMAFNEETGKDKLRYWITL